MEFRHRTRRGAPFDHDMFSYFAHGFSNAIALTDVRVCMERGDATAFAAVWARLLRIAEHSLSTDKGIQDQTQV